MELLAGGGDDGNAGPLQADTIAGATPAYAAPEQFEASRLSQAPSIDVWALGVVLNGLSPRRIEYYSNYRYYRSYKKYYGSQG